MRQQTTVQPQTNSSAFSPPTQIKCTVRDPNEKHSISAHVFEIFSSTSGHKPDEKSPCERTHFSITHCYRDPHPRVHMILPTGPNLSLSFHDIAHIRWDCWVWRSAIEKKGHDVCGTSGQSGMDATYERVDCVVEETSTCLIVVSSGLFRYQSSFLPIFFHSQLPRVGSDEKCHHSIPHAFIIRFGIPPDLFFLLFFLCLF